MAVAVLVVIGLVFGKRETTSMLRVGCAVEAMKVAEGKQAATLVKARPSGSRFFDHFWSKPRVYLEVKFDF
jgi:hypothetical protein